MERVVTLKVSVIRGVRVCANGASDGGKASALARIHLHNDYSVHRRLQTHLLHVETHFDIGFSETKHKGIALPNGPKAGIIQVHFHLNLHFGG